MPTPIQHLAIAEQLLRDSTLPGAIRDRLLEQRGAFLFGNTAPDVQTVSGQLRETTHFFDIPLRSNEPAHHNGSGHGLINPGLDMFFQPQPAQGVFSLTLFVPRCS